MEGPITSKEIYLTCLLWVWFIQSSSFKELFSALMKNKNHSLKNWLGVKVDEFDILRCYGRYANADIDTKSPKLLPCKHQFVKLVIMEIHCRLVHAGVSHTLSHLRSRAEPFQFIRLDYLGPINVKEGDSVGKMWVCLFTCLSIRAVHLELVKGLSALDCLHRFISHRGRPRSIICGPFAPLERVL